MRTKTAGDAVPRWRRRCLGAIRSLSPAAAIVATLTLVIGGLGLAVDGLQGAALAASAAPAGGVTAHPAPTPPGIVFAHQAAKAFGHTAILGRQGTRPPAVTGTGPVIYHGGPIQPDPRIHVIFWGLWWSSTCTGQEGNGASDESYLYNFYNGMGSSSDKVSPVASQYGDSGDNFPTFPTQAGHLFIDWAVDCSNPPAAATQTQLGDEAASYANYLDAHGQSIGINDQIVVVSPSGTNPGGGFGSSYCAWHSWVEIASTAVVSYTNLPFILDQGSNCGADFVQNGFDGWSIVGGHEYLESVTDPDLNAWYDSSGLSGEIGDKCAWQGLFATTLPTGTFAMQPEWSNATGNCQPVDSISLVSPGSQATNLNAAVDLQIVGSSSQGNPISYTAGLPNGLTIDSSGLISGHARRPGNFAASVQASDISPGTQASVNFSWRVYPPHGALKVRLTSHCASGSGLGNGTKVKIQHCATALAQTWAAFPDSTLRRYGGPDAINTNACVNIAHASSKNGALIDLYRCDGGSNQVWTYNSASHEWKNPHSGKCLRARSLTNGTQLELWSCSSKITTERWTNV